MKRVNGDHRAVGERPAVQTFPRPLGGGVVGEAQKHRPDVLRVERRAEGVRAHNAHLPHLPERLALQRRLLLDLLSLRGVHQLLARRQAAQHDGENAATFVVVFIRVLLLRSRESVVFVIF